MTLRPVSQELLARADLARKQAAQAEAGLLAVLDRLQWTGTTLSGMMRAPPLGRRNKT